MHWPSGLFSPPFFTSLVYVLCTVRYGMHGRLNNRVCDRRDDCKGEVEGK